jgi:hypothetical protein
MRSLPLRVGEVCTWNLTTFVKLLSEREVGGTERSRLTRKLTIVPCQTSPSP